MRLELQMLQAAMWVLEPNLGPLQEQLMLLMAEPPQKSQYYYLSEIRTYIVVDHNFQVYQTLKNNSFCENSQEIKIQENLTEKSSTISQSLTTVKFSTVKSMQLGRQKQVGGGVIHTHLFLFRYPLTGETIKGTTAVTWRLCLLMLQCSFVVRHLEAAVGLLMPHKKLSHQGTFPLTTHVTNEYANDQGRGNPGVILALEQFF